MKRMFYEDLPAAAILMGVQGNGQTRDNLTMGEPRDDWSEQACREYIRRVCREAAEILQRETLPPQAPDYDG